MSEIFRTENKRKWSLLRLRKIEKIFLDEIQCFSGIFVRPSDTFCLTAGV